MNLPRLILNVGGHRIDARVARDDDARAQGLMHCESLAPDEGMLFIHDEPEASCFWMKNTPMHLSVAFIDDSGTVVNVEEMSAHCEDGVCAVAPVRFVLEMSEGWFAERGLGAGAAFTGLPTPAARTPDRTPG